MAVLSNGLRVISQRGLYQVFGAGNPGRKKAGDDDYEGPVILPAKNLKPFISDELTKTLNEPVAYRPLGAQGGGNIGYGFDANVIPDICEVWLAAREARALHYRQVAVAAKAEIIVRALSRVGIIALIDEATGYQAERDRDELMRILHAYIAEQLQPWLSRFPHEFFKQIHRLWGWVYIPNSTHGPRYVGKLINKYIYERLPAGVLGELQRKNPSINGRRKNPHYKWLTGDTGVPHLDKQITAVTTLLQISDSKTEFESHLKRAFPKKGDNLDLPFPKPPKSDEEE